MSFSAIAALSQSRCVNILLNYARIQRRVLLKDYAA